MYDYGSNDSVEGVDCSSLCGGPIVSCTDTQLEIALAGRCERAGRVSEGGRRKFFQGVFISVTREHRGMMHRVKAFRAVGVGSGGGGFRESCYGGRVG